MHTVEAAGLRNYSPDSQADGPWAVLAPDLEPAVAQPGFRLSRCVSLEDRGEPGGVDVAARDDAHDAASPGPAR